MARGDNDHWMEEAFGNAHGQFKKKAYDRGESTKEFANEASKKGADVSSKTKKQAVLARTAARINARR